MATLRQMDTEKGAADFYNPQARVSASPDARNKESVFTGLRKNPELRYETQELVKGLLPLYQPFIGWEDFYQFAIDGDFFAMKVGDEEEVVASGLA